MSKDKITLPSAEAMLALLKSPEYEEALVNECARMQAENAVVEVAEWFGTTGLPDDVERGVSQYLRREFGESLNNPDGLKAEDLKYVSAFDEADGRVFYWRIPYGNEEVYAFVVVGEEYTFTGWGDRKPPLETVK